MLHINGERLIVDLRELATFGRHGTGVDRIALSQPDIAARRWLADRMRQAGLAAGMDRVGNVFGQYPGVARAVLIGSHTDTVPRGGWLDGALGVSYAIEIARALLETKEALPVGVDAISFQDEEGTYLPFLGSRSFCDDMSEAEIAGAKSKAGEPLAAALAPISAERSPFRREPARHVGYLEAHIEQGPRLEAAGRRIGVVTGLVGIRRYRVCARGQADHAGTTPMAMRRDAGAALFRLASRVATEFPRLGGPDTVWNIGTLALRPGAANVVPGEAEMILEFRDVAPAILDRLEESVRRWIDAESRRPVAIDLEVLARIPPAAMSAEIGALITAAARERGEESVAMPSGAGHDAMVLSRYMPAAMLFVPSIGGRSHDISEDTREADIVLGCQVLAGAVEKLIKQ